MAEMDYCHYIISKCGDVPCIRATNGAFPTTKAFLTAFEGSSSYRKIAVKQQNRVLLESLAEIIKRETKDLSALKSDVLTVRERCLRKLDAAKTYDDIFSVVSDFLWIMASKQATTGNVVSMTDNDDLERKHGIKWITEFKREIENAQYDLSCMEKARDLPFVSSIFLGLISDQDVAWYANTENISHGELMQRIEDCKAYLRTTQFLYYVFIATTIYREDLKRRYR